MNRYFRVVVAGFFLLYLTSFQAGAQRIYFSDTTNEWKTVWSMMEDPGIWRSYIYHYYTSDTLSENNGRFYTEIKGSSSDRILVRDDTAANLVFAKVQSSNASFYRVTDSNEFVYLNYNLQVGDTLIMPLVFARNEEDSISVHVVSTIDSFIANGLQYRKFEMNAYRGMGLGTGGEYATWYTIYEGIGPGSGPLIESSPSGEWGPTKLICFSNSGIIPPIFNQNCFDPVGIKEPAEQRKHILFYPNPVWDQLKVKDLERSGNPYVLKIVDLRGKVLRQMTFHNEATLDLHEVPPGLYFIQFLKGPVIIQSEKLIINH